jgi:uncharacterized membrane protein
MERMLVAVFDGEAKAYDGFHALQALERDGALSVYSSRVVIKYADGSIDVRRTEGLLPEGTLVGTVVGTLIGLLGGPVGFALGATTGLALGAVTDYTRARAGKDVVKNVSKDLAPGKAAVVAEIDEEFTGSADARIKAIGGSVFRRDLLDIENAEYDRDMAALGARPAREDAERAQLRIDGKRRWKARMDALSGKLHRLFDRAKA